MRHLVAGKKLGRDIKSRKALLNNLASALFMRGQITTTLAKAKFVQGYVEKSITIAKKNRLAAKRKIASALDYESFKKLIAEIAPGFSERQGGYTRIVKMSPRTGDNAPMARIALLAIDKSKILPSKGKIKAMSKKPATTNSTENKLKALKEKSVNSVVARKGSKRKVTKVKS